MSKMLIVDTCGECPYSDGDTATKLWYCMHPSNIDSYGVGELLGENKIETLNSIAEVCPMRDLMDFMPSCIWKRVKRIDDMMAPNSIDDLYQSQVDIPNDFKVVLNELAANNLDVNNINDLIDKIEGNSP